MSQYTHLYQNQAWRKRRQYQLLTEPLCRYCLLLGRHVPATVADHIEPHRGDEEKFLFGALQSLCAPCHSSAKQSEEHGHILKGSSATGEPIDPRHHWNAGEGGGQR